MSLDLLRRLGGMCEKETALVPFQWLADEIEVTRPSPLRALHLDLCPENEPLTFMDVIQVREHVFGEIRERIAERLADLVRPDPERPLCDRIHDLNAMVLALEQPQRGRQIDEHLAQARPIAVGLRARDLLAHQLLARLRGAELLGDVESHALQEEQV